jgi:hypothetical protein
MALLGHLVRLWKKHSLSGDRLPNLDASSVLWYDQFIYLICFAQLIYSFLAMGTLWTLQSSQPGLSLYSKLPLAYGVSYQAISLSVNVILTILITIRLLMHRRTIMNSLPEDHAKQYISLATIIVESAALYSVFAVIFLITYAVNNPINQIFLSVASSSQVDFATYLHIVREQVLT